VQLARVADEDLQRVQMVDSHRDQLDDRVRHLIRVATAVVPREAATGFHEPAQRTDFPPLAPVFDVRQQRLKLLSRLFLGKSRRR
jgi:hypothetical protein